MYLDNRRIPGWIKAAVVAQIREHGRTRVEVAAELHLEKGTVAHWVIAAIREEEAAARRGPSPEEAERARLLARLDEAEREIRGWRRGAGQALAAGSHEHGAGSAQESLRPPLPPLPTPAGSAELPARPLVPLSGIPLQQGPEIAR